MLACYQPQLRKLEDLNERWEHLAKWTHIQVLHLQEGELIRFR
ncbi:hypothetical protein IFVP22_C210270 [Vibrio parahaemolyticus]